MNGHIDRQTPSVRQNDEHTNGQTVSQAE